MSTEPQPPDQLPSEPSSEPSSVSAGQPVPAGEPLAAPSNLPNPPIQPVTAPPLNTPAQPADRPKSSTAETPSKGRALLRMGSQLAGIVATVVPLVLNLLVKALKGLWKTWNAVLPRIRALLPEPWKTRLPNQLFTAIALALLLLILSIPSLLSPQPAPIASRDQPLERPAPAPKVEVNKLVKIQGQLAEVADTYAVGIVQSVSANSRQQLTVALDDRWYALLPDQQDRFASEMQKRSQRLKFDRVALTDSEGKLIARSPVVGSKMLVLERSRAIKAVEPSNAET